MPNSFKNTALHLMCDQGKKRMVDFLLTIKNINPNACSKKKNTPLHFAALTGRSSCIQLLLAAPGINTQAKNYYGEIPLDRACESGNKKSVKLLLPSNENINIQDYYGFTPLHTASIFGHEDIVKLLLKKGANPLIKNHDEATAPLLLHHEKNTLNPFITQGKKNPLLKKDNQGNTQLHLSATVSRVDITKTLDNYLLELIHNGVNIWSRNKNKQLAIDCAHESYNNYYQFFIKNRALNLHTILGQHEATVHAFLRVTSMHTECALFKKTFAIHSPKICVQMLPVSV